MIKIEYSKNININDIRVRFPDDEYKFRDTAAAIVKDVRENGDEAVLRYTKKFDGEVSSLLVSESEINASLEQIDGGLYNSLSTAAKNIREFHMHQLTEGFSVKSDDGVEMGQRVMPLAKVGLYIPGGTARYPSSLLMNAIPAKIAGVKHIALATPPDKDGSIPSQILAAAHIAGVTRIYKMGGAQAIAALAYGTKSVEAVDKITGPGNSYVTAAKRLVFGVVDIDMIAGPSEILIIADESAKAKFVAADMLAQAEHDVMAASILLTTSEKLAGEVQSELELQIKALPRSEMASKSILDNGRIIITSSLNEAASLSNEIAPEHLELCISDPRSLLGEIINAGSVFLGEYSPEALGDYFAGPNHTLPTNGAARFSSPLGVYDFVKRSSYIYYTKEALKKAAPHIECIAKSEELLAHAKSAIIRFE